MLRKYQPKLFGVVGLMALLAALAISAIAAASASAEAGGPVWSIEGATLKGGEEAAFTSEGGKFTLDGTANIACETEQDTGVIIGTNPGLDLSTIEFLKCHLETNVNCLAGNSGAETIITEVQSVLVYPHEEPETDGQAYDAFFPDNKNTSENLFVEFTLTGGSSVCGLLNGVKVDVTATGTLVTADGINKKCGVLAEVGYLDSLSQFVLAEAGNLATIGALNSTGQPEEATIWNPTTKEFELIECKLSALGAALELGLSDITLVSGLAFGWNLP